MYTTRGTYGIEPILPIRQESWRTKGSKGTMAIVRLLQELSPYQRGNIGDSTIHYLVNQSACFLIATDLESDLDSNHHAHPVGLIRVEVWRSGDKRYGVLHDLVVAREAQNRKLGRGLVEKALHMTRMFELPTVRLAVKVKPSREAALRLFEKLGFQETAPAGRTLPGSAKHFQFALTAMNQS